MNKHTIVNYSHKQTYNCEIITKVSKKGNIL